MLWELAQLLLGGANAEFTLDLPLSQGQGTQDGLEFPRGKDLVFSWVGANGFCQREMVRRCVCWGWS